MKSLEKGYRQIYLQVKNKNADVENGPKDPGGEERDVGLTGR